MPWETIFGAANLYAMVCWAILAFAPQRERLITPLFYAGAGLLAASYAVLIVGLLGGMIDGGPGGGGTPDFTTLAGVQALFDSQGGATIGWIHYLAFDLFVGIWVARNADRHGYMRIVQIPILFFVFMAGPFGLTSYLLLRLSCKSRPEDSTVPS
ncbi:MAG TPA: ABA4-like family protein [Sphingorhabdus sp.]|jgi:hypothetical protein|nr:ABA4-like family protein [Sphingorhabdus sp.]